MHKIRSVLARNALHDTRKYLPSGLQGRLKPIVPYDNSIVRLVNVPEAASISLHRMKFVVTIDKQNISPSSISSYVKFCAVGEHVLYSGMTI